MHLKPCLFHATAGVDEPKAFSVGAHALEEALPHTLVEVDTLAVQTVNSALSRLAATPRIVRRQVEEKCRVRRSTSGCQGVDLIDELRGDATTVALVGVGRIGEAVT